MSHKPGKIMAVKQSIANRERIIAKYFPQNPLQKTIQPLPKRKKK